MREKEQLTQKIDKLREKNQDLMIVKQNYCFALS